ncbi:MAG TPA: DNA-processing protein DprA [bacterium]|nr:DNA-processing protein DprA [bacterium]HPN42549.1 DNA-processing protein DprA [bacterium]
MQHFNRATLLQLCTVPGIGSKKVCTLLARFKTPEAVLAASFRELMEIEGISKALATAVKNHHNDVFVQQQLELVEKTQAKLVSYWDKQYPPLLKKIDDPPVILFVRGEVYKENEKCLALVGTRSPSTYGKLITEQFSRELTRNHITVVSGLARGIDTIAHQTVVVMEGRTIAVLGSGVDMIYPAENERLAEKIVSQGAVVSEFPMGAKPEAVYFPRRNRIISGLCTATLVIEAGQKSGALITTDKALEQGRDVFVVPGNINNPKSAGCNLLIQQGAKLVSCIEDILEEFSVDSRTAQTAQTELAMVDLSRHEEQVFNLLSNEPMHIDQISAQGGLPVSQTLSILLSLELKNLVKQIIGKHFIRAL